MTFTAEPAYHHGSPGRTAGTSRGRRARHDLKSAGP